MQFLRRSGEQGAALRRRRPCNMRRAACSVQRQRAARSVQRYPDASGCERYQLFVQRVYYAHTASSKSPESFGSCCPPALTSPRSLYVTVCRWPRAASVYFLDVLPSLQPSHMWCCLRIRHDKSMLQPAICKRLCCSGWLPCNSLCASSRHCATLASTFELDQLARI